MTTLAAVQQHQDLASLIELYLTSCRIGPQVAALLLATTIVWFAVSPAR